MPNMTMIRLLACAPILLASACLSLPGYNPPAGAIVSTQVDPEPLATCIAQAAGTSASSDARGYRIDVPEQSGTTQLTVIRDKVQTNVVRADEADGPTRASKIAVDCALKLAPPSSSAARAAA